MCEPALPASVEAGRSSLEGTVRGWRGCRDDIAKGRGGDHSALGKRDARQFCRKLLVSKADTLLVTWLVALLNIGFGLFPTMPLTLANASAALLMGYSG